MTHRHDVIVVGARLAGAATALLLARAGHRVVVVDRARRGSDTLSTHALMRPAVLQLERWGVLDTIVAGGTPGHDTVVFHYGDDRVEVATKRPLYAPRRTVLDPVLVAAAEREGATFRFGVDVRGVTRDERGSVDGVVVRRDDHRTEVVAGALVVGADGRRSRIARAVAAPVLHRGGTASAFAYGYWSDVATDGFEWCFRPGSTAGLVPTDDGLTCVFVGVPAARFGELLRPDLEEAVDRVLRRTSPAVAERVARGRLVGRVRGFPGMPSVLRRPRGAGWALVGDAGYWKDPTTAHGISDALRDAELLADAVHGCLVRGDTSWSGLADYEAVRDRLSRPVLDATDAVAGFGWDVSEVRRLHMVLSEAMQVEVDLLRSLDLPAVDRSGARAGGRGATRRVA